MTVPVTRITFERKAITMDRIVRRRVASLHDVVHDLYRGRADGYHLARPGPGPADRACVCAVVVTMNVIKSLICPDNPSGLAAIFSASFCALRGPRGG